MRTIIVLAGVLLLVLATVAVRMLADARAEARPAVPAYCQISNPDPTQQLLMKSSGCPQT